MSAIACNAKSLYEYCSDASDELDLFPGDLLQVLVKHDDDWWYVRHQNGREGLIPSNYVEILPADTSSALTDESDPTLVLPSGWDSAVDTRTNETYYYNLETGAVQWNFPKASLESNYEGNRLNYIEDDASSTLSSLPKKMLIATTNNRKLQNNIASSDDDILEFRRLREEADAKLNALR
jgi:hypothetical protein